LHDHWQALREGNLPPFRSEISPRDIPDVLDTLFILEHFADGDTRIRLSGLTICELAGMEVRGLNPDSVFSSANPGRFSAIIADVLAEASIAEITLGARDSKGKDGRLSMIVLPLRSDFGDVNRAIGCIDRVPAGLAAPVTIEILKVTMQPILSERAVIGFRDSTFLQSLKSVNIASDKCGHFPRKGQQHLRVVR